MNYLFIIIFRIVFSQYVAKNNIQKIRRYSIDKVYEEGPFSPNEIQECAFQIISPEKTDQVLDAEILFIGKEIIEKILPNESIQFIINHRIIFSLIVKHCKMSKKDASHFTIIMRNAAVSYVIF